MDDKWFKAQQKKAGITAEDIANHLGRDRSVVSRIYTGRQKMSLEWAQAFADALNVPIDEVLLHAGVTSPGAENDAPGSVDQSDRRVSSYLAPQHAKRLRENQTDADALPLQGSNHEKISAQKIANCLITPRDGLEIWTVVSSAMQLSGYMPGDHLVIDRNQSETCRSGDVVLAELHHRSKAGHKTALRRLQTPVLVADSADPAHRDISVVDTINTVIRGKVIASWRR